jgi:hypothetical protein
VAVMPTPFESAQLILRLYETRRDETMRKARSFWFEFDPQNVDEYFAAMMGPDGGYVRMVVSYWEMAASFVENGAIDRKMFEDANAEHVVVFAKIEPLLAGIREKYGTPGFAAHLERMILSAPDGRQKVDDMKARIHGMMAARKAASASA